MELKSYATGVTFLGPIKLRQIVRKKLRQNVLDYFFTIMFSKLFLQNLFFQCRSLAIRLFLNRYELIDFVLIIGVTLLPMKHPKMLHQLIKLRQNVGVTFFYCEKVTPKKLRRWRNILPLLRQN